MSLVVTSSSPRRHLVVTSSPPRPRVVLASSSPRPHLVLPSSSPRRPFLCAPPASHRELAVCSRSARAGFCGVKINPQELSMYMSEKHRRQRGALINERGDTGY